MYLSAYYLSKCSRDDPDLDGCFRNTANRLAKYLRNGVPELGIEQVYFKCITSDIYLHLTYVCCLGGASDN